MSSLFDYVEKIVQDGACENGHIYNSGMDFVGSTSETEPLKSSRVINNIRVDDRTVLSKGLANEGEIDTKNGIYIDNIKYYTINFDNERSVWYLGAEGGGACVAKTNSLILIGTWSQGQKMANGQAQNAATCNWRIETLRDELISFNY